MRLQTIFTFILYTALTAAPINEESAGMIGVVSGLFGGFICLHLAIRSSSFCINQFRKCILRQANLEEIKNHRIQDNNADIETGFPQAVYVGSGVLYSQEFLAEAEVQPINLEIVDNISDEDVPVAQSALV